MKFGNKTVMNEETNMKITGKNFLFALLIALIITFLITAIYTLMASIVASSDGTFNSISISVFEWAIRKFFLIFKMIGICVVPVFFLIVFALLQRFRIKH